MPSSSPPPDGACPICNSSRLTDFFEVPRAPSHICVLGSTPEEARRAPMREIVLTYCERCGFVHNRRHDPDGFTFEPGYEASLVHSRVYQRHVQTVCRRLVDRYHLEGRTVLEIGCGAGHFLRALCGMARARGVGVDPTIAEETTVSIEGGGEVQLIRAHFDPDAFAEIDEDFICCLSVFESLHRPRAFLDSLRRRIGNRLDVRLYFDVPDSSYYFRTHATWSIYYEQCNHFTLETLSRIFRDSGFDVLETGSSYEADQYAYIEAAPAERPAEHPLTPSRGEDRAGGLPQDLASFRDHHRQNVATWNGKLESFRQAGLRVVLWGSGSTCIGFLNALDAGDVIRYVVDINPLRQGRFVPGSGQKIVSPEFLLSYRPDRVIITNVAYEEEIRSRVSELGVQCGLSTI